ncbi:MAG TPA: PAS domain S-box protein [Spirochaetota bacterium]|nr:PAS domain S-box protein [Spirochaetota bacterium]
MAPDHEKLFESMTTGALIGQGRAEVIPAMCADGLEKTFRWTTMLIGGDEGNREKAVVFFGNEAPGLGSAAMTSSIEERYRLLFENAGISFLYIREDTVIALSNKEFEKMSGFSKAEVEGKMSWTDFVISEEDLGRITEYHRLRRVAPSLAPETYDTKIRVKDGRVLDVLVRVIMVPGSTYSLASLFDMTERRIAEEAVRESEQKYRSLVDNMQDTLYRCDINGKILFASPSCARLVGASSLDGIIGRNIANDFYWNPDDRAILLQHLKKNGRVTNYEVTLKRMDGSPITVITNSHFYCDKSGNVLGIEGIFSDITRIRRIEKEIARLAAIVRHSSEMVNLTDLEGRMLFLNEAGSRILGIEQQDVESASIFQVIHDSYRTVWNNEVLPALEAGSGWEGELRYVNMKTGATTDVHTVLFTIVDPDAAHMKYLANISLDISQGKKTELMLFEKEKMLRQINRNIPGVVYQFYATDSGEFGISYASERISEYFGLDFEMKDLFHLFMSFIHEEDRGHMMASIVKAIETLSQWEFEGRYTKPSGELIWVHGISTPTRLEGRIVFDGIMLDITARKLAEEKSRQNEEKFMNVFMMAPDCIVISRLSDGMILDVNMGFEEITGLRRDRVIGRTAIEIGAWEDPDERSYMVKTVRAGSDIRYREYLFKRRDGSPRTGLYSARAMNIGGEACLIFVMQDITERLNLEDQRLKLEQRLNHSQKMDAIGQLAGGVAHDFNNILTGIQGNASLILMDCSPEHPHYQRVARIEEYVKRGANLTRQLLGFARGGKYELRTLSINELIRRSLQFFIETRKEIRANLRLEDEILPVEADSGQMEQVLLNIYINAAHAMPEGGLLDIETSIIALTDAEARSFEIGPGDYVKISITDSGIGMTEDTLKRVFEPFFTTRLQHEGSGLGLASAYGIIRNHGGAIHASSSLGRGSTFTIYLPVSAKEIEHENRDRKSDFIPGRGVILLVDDEPMILGPTSELLKKIGYRVYTTQSGYEAVLVFSENREEIDLVILDMIMPGMGGTEVLKKIMEIDPDARVILSSGYSMQGEIRKLMEIGCRGFIQKPYNFTELSSVIHQVLNDPDTKNI